MERAKIEELFYGTPQEQRRFTQDFPILPDVWIEFAEHPTARRELLLTPHDRTNAPTLTRALRERLQAERAVEGPDRKLWDREHKPEEDARILFNGSVVLAEFSFWELMRVAMPLTDWWSHVVATILDDWNREKLMAFLEGDDFETKDRRLVKKLVSIVGAIECDKRGIPGTLKHMDEKKLPQDDKKLPREQLEGFATIFEGLTNPQEKRGLLWSVSQNRYPTTSLWRSRNAVKADAAARLFEVRTEGVRWAVLDTGIDARHPAFSKRKADRTRITDLEPDDEGEPQFPSRILRTYDFLRVKWLLDPDSHNPKRPRSYRPDEDFKNSTAARDPKKFAEMREDLRLSLDRARGIDWDLLEPFLRIPHDNNYVGPTHRHGTHVAGIIAADWPEAAKETLGHEVQGMCPGLEMYDVRVLGPGGDEFTTIAALQFVRHLNANKDNMLVHGLNLSLSVVHDVANFACGRTPVCEECERAVNAGMVVVAAAGNRGFNRYPTSQDGASGDYRFISITDPGNADSVITVGSTHRYMPHNYGVSYFSSRGPTGDGRTKPDLVAPGERIDSCSLNNDYETMDGTSQAAPHVSGAAALLIARHRELVGQPRRVKEILCKTATDLGREPRFQGAGMLDVLRALQSV